MAAAAARLSDPTPPASSGPKPKKDWSKITEDELNKAEPEPVRLPPPLARTPRPDRAVRLTALESRKATRPSTTCSRKSTQMPTQTSGGPCSRATRSQAVRFQSDCMCNAVRSRSYTNHRLA